MILKMEEEGNCYKLAFGLVKEKNLSQKSGNKPYIVYIITIILTTNALFAEC